MMPIDVADRLDEIEVAYCTQREANEELVP
jgi:hypothetical protein